MILPPKPQKFTPARGILTAAFSPPPQLKPRRYTGRRLQGIRYERQVQEYLQWRYGNMYLASPWLRFFGDGGWRWCQPDGILFEPMLGKLTIVEIKYQHTVDAWWQIRHLYQPVLEQMLPPGLWQYEVCEVVKWYDPAVEYPEQVVLANEVNMPHHHFKVHICKP